MKLKFHDSAGGDVRSLVWPKEVGGSSLRRLPARQRGIALVVTLILLAVVTFMAVTFLALSRRERGAVTTVTDTATARLAADAALANAQAQIIANIFATTNAYAYDYGLLVSTNYINANGFNPAAGANPTNVNYYDSSGNFLTGNNFLTNVANLYYLPRAPVFVPSPPDNYANPTNYDFRFYLDLNRNGRFDTNGVVANVDNSSNYLGTITEVGDPEWIGILEHPDAPHGPNNPFIARYAFIAMPADNTLDLNYIYNDAMGIRQGLSMANDGFMRNQGVGSWEINLAAFLTDLNTNQWDPPTIENVANNPYQYNTYSGGSDNIGAGFEDALALLRYRYSTNGIGSFGSYNYLTNANAMFTNIENYPYNIDFYSDGPLQTTFDTNEGFFVDNDNPSLLWSGADNPTHYFDLSSELFDPLKISGGATGGFTNRLLSADNGISTYDRYTFYRLLSQLGTDSSAESGKLNLNYRNVTNGVIIPGMETNFYPWTALEFFTTAADRMLRLYTTNWFQTNPSNYLATYYALTNYNDLYYNGYSNVVYDPSGFGLTNAFWGWTNTIPAFGITNIPVWVNGQFVYSSAMQRVLQLAANIYDASTNSFYPDVFRPTFYKDINGNVFINGYQQVEFNGIPNISAAPLDAPVDVTSSSLALNATVNTPNGNVYGVPWIIGAKKGFPNFNEFSMESIVQVTRKLRFTRPSTNTIASYNQYHLSKYSTNQLYVFSISNSIGVECWNSYATNYPYPVQVVARDNISMMLTNDDKGLLNDLSGYPLPYSIGTNFTVSSWSGSAPWNSANGQPTNASFIIPLNTTLILLTNYNYYFGTAPPGVAEGFYSQGLNLGWETNLTGFPFPHFGLLTTNRLQVFMLDGNHVIDYVQLNGPDSSRDINAELTNPDKYDPNGLWQTNTIIGISNQIQLSKGGMVPNIVPTEDGPQWDSINGMSIPEQQAYFDAFFSGDNMAHVVGSSEIETNLQLIKQAPYTPTRTMVQYISWQANDPLIHYLPSDLNFNGNSTGSGTLRTGITNADRIALPTLPNLGYLNDRYDPWGGSPVIALNPTQLTADTNAYNLAIKDPLMWQSDDWNFPTNKFPTVGWLGRVHRGTPWQTVYLKYPGIDTNSWANWTENFNVNDAINAMPVQDRLLFDLFTTAPNDNATRGQLSINGASLAAWSALLSGMVVLTNVTVSPSRTTTPSNNWFTINPAGGNGLNSPLGDLVTNIYNTRTNFPLQVFGHVGDILSVPQLTQESPFLNWSNTAQQEYGISDEMYEWLPQQMMSLLRVSSVPRYVIYSYGQTLKPAPNGISTASGSFGLVTNYQIVSETATRAVVQVHSTLVTNNLNHLVTTNYSTTIEQFNTLPSD